MSEGIGSEDGPGDAGGLGESVRRVEPVAPGGAPGGEEGRAARIALAVAAAPEHAAEGHPERPERIPAILEAIEREGLASALDRISSAPAPRAWLEAVHEPFYLDRLAEPGPGLRWLDPAPTYAGPSSWADARLAAGAACAVVEAVLDGAPAGLALVRPPGHHALPGHAMGFCLLGNVAVAARRAQARGIGRLAIVDVDVHHGNGTQAVFWRDPSVLFVSLHQAGIYPGGGGLDERGAGPGVGATANLPLPAGAGDAAMAAAFEGFVLPLLDRFRPELILVSAGFDAHVLDPLAGLSVTGAGYHAMSLALRAAADRWAGGRLAFVLEGGYDLRALGEGVVNVLRAQLGRSPSAAPPGGREPDVAPLLAEARRTQGLG